MGGSRVSERFLDMKVDWPMLPDCNFRENGFCLTHDQGIRHCAALAQHEADMLYEVACPCGCHEAAEHGGNAGRMIDAEPWGCKLCGATGRVTIGRIVEADRRRAR